MKSLVRLAPNIDSSCIFHARRTLDNLLNKIESVQELFEYHDV
jgi:hypothetical protein